MRSSRVGGQSLWNSCSLSSASASLFWAKFLADAVCDLQPILSPNAIAPMIAMSEPSLIFNRSLTWKTPCFIASEESAEDASLSGLELLRSTQLNYAELKAFTNQTKLYDVALHSRICAAIAGMLIYSGCRYLRNRCRWEFIRKCLGNCTVKSTLSSASSVVLTSIIPPHNADANEFACSIPPVTFVHHNV